MNFVKSNKRKKHIRVTSFNSAGKMKISCVGEEDLQEKMEEIVEPYLKKFCHSGFEHGIYYELYPQENSVGTIVISYGFTESCEKYHEMIYYFLLLGYQVAIWDHRGHGKSVREVTNKSLVHVEDFSQYVEDFHWFMRTHIVSMQKKKPLYLYAHSMGGCIGALYLERHPGYFSKAVLNAPMLGIQLGRMPLWAARIVCKVCILAGQGKKRIYFMQEFQEEEPFSMSGTNSGARYAFYRELQKKHEEYQTSCCTYNWAYGAIKAGRQVLRQKNMDKVTIPVLLFQAEEDTFVKPGPQEMFVASIPNGRLTRVKSRHEIGRSVNEIMEPYLAQVVKFFASCDNGTP